MKKQLLFVALCLWAGPGEACEVPENINIKIETSDNVQFEIEDYKKGSSDLFDGIFEDVRYSEDPNSEDPIALPFDSGTFQIFLDLLKPYSLYPKEYRSPRAQVWEIREAIVNSLSDEQLEDLLQVISYLSWYAPMGDLVRELASRIKFPGASARKDPSVFPKKYPPKNIDEVMTVLRLIAVADKKGLIDQRDLFFENAFHLMDFKFLLSHVLYLINNFSDGAIKKYWDFGLLRGKYLEKIERAVQRLIDEKDLEGSIDQPYQADKDKARHRAIEEVRGCSIRSYFGGGGRIISPDQIRLLIYIEHKINKNQDLPEELQFAYATLDPNMQTVLEYAYSDYKQAFESARRNYSLLSKIEGAEDLD